MGESEIDQYLTRMDELKTSVFICHASEDKKHFVRPLAQALKASGIDVWYDEYSLKLGDSLRESIDKGLARSRYAIVVLSPDFFAKRWTNWELNGLVQRHLSSKDGVILPIWLNVNAQTVMEASPSLADILAVRAEIGLQRVVEKLLTHIKGDQSAGFFSLLPSTSLAIEYFGTTDPTFTGLTFDEMCELLEREEINLDRLSPDAVSGIENCAMHFKAPKPGLLHLLWHHRVALQKGVPDSPEAERLSRLGLVFFDRRTGYVLTDDGKRFLLLMKVRIANGNYQTLYRSDHPIEHEPIFTGLTFEEMRETLRAEDIDLDNLSSGAVSGIKDCVVQFNDSKASLLHVLWYFQDILWGGDRKNP
jgi:hypothetical protein